MPAASHAVAQAFRKSPTGTPSRWNTSARESDVVVLLKEAGLPATVNQLRQITFQHYRAASAGLGCFGAKPDGSGVPVHVSPPQRGDLAFPPAREVGEPGEVSEVVGQGSDDGL